VSDPRSPSVPQYPPYPPYLPHPPEDAHRPAAPVSPVSPLMPVAPPYPAPMNTGPSYVMPGDPDYDERHKRAKKRVEEVRGFYSHLASFVGVMTLLIAINLLTSPRYFWFVWPLLGWGFGLVAHAWGTFGANRFLGKEWEERKIREEMRRRP